MELLILIIAVAWIWLFLEMRSTKEQLKLLQKRFMALSSRFSQWEQHLQNEPISPTLDEKTIPPTKAPAVSPTLENTKATTQPANVPLQAPPPPTTVRENTLGLDEISSPKHYLSAQSRPDAVAVKAARQATQPMYEPVNLPVNSSENNRENQIENNRVNHKNAHSAKATTPPRPPQRPAAPTWWDKGVAYAKNWLTTGNIPVKIGMLVLIAAVIAFLRYATHQGWLRLPTEYKLLGVAATAVGALIFAWLKRDSKRSFSLSVQGGSIGILLLVIFSAVKMYGLLSPNVGFVLSVLAILLAAVLALQQDAKALAIMAIFAGFLAPIWLSDGTGSHVVLFSYYAILNLGIFIIAWLKPWRELNLMGFVFTYVIGSTWGGLRYDEAHFSTTEPFVILFFLFYLFIPLRYVHRQAQTDKNTWRYADRVDSALLFGTPLVTLGLQVGMLHNDSDKLALSCLATGLVYAVLAWILRGKSAYETLQKAYTGLAAGFITLAVPIGLSAKATTTIFALEGAGALWLGTREKRPLTWLAGALLQVAAAIGFAVAYQQVSHFPQAIINDYYLNALLIAVAGWVATWICYRGGQSAQRGVNDSTTQSANQTKFALINTLFDKHNLTLAARGFFLWGMVWWLGSAAHEIVRYAPTARQIHDGFLLLTLTALVLLFAYRYYRDNVVISSLSAFIIAGIGFAVLRLSGVMTLPHHTDLPIFNQAFSPVTFYQLLTWGIYALVGGWAWRQLRDNEHSWIDVAVTTWVLALATTISTVIYHYLPTTWGQSGLYWWAILSVWLALMAVLTYLPHVATWVGQRPKSSAWQSHLSLIIAVVLAVGFARLLILSGDGTTWWLPIFNGIELLQISIAALLLSWLVKNRAEIHWLYTTSYLLAITLVIGITWRMNRHWIGSDDTQIMANLSRFGDWYYLAIYGFWVALALLIDFVLPKYYRLQARWAIVSEATWNTIVVMLAVVWLYFLTLSGNATPLPWIPVLNPLAVLQWSILGLAWLGLRHYHAWFDESRRSIIVPTLMLVLISVMTLRLVHHSADITWGVAMFQTAIVQMALTVVWSILGVISWIVGSKRQSRPIWLLGAVLMSVVLIKLILVDRGHLGNLFGILSFFAYGLLCVIVGYFAPVPPAAKQSEDKSLESLV